MHPKSSQAHPPLAFPVFGGGLGTPLPGGSAGLSSRPSLSCVQSHWEAGSTTHPRREGPEPAGGGCVPPALPCPLRAPGLGYAEAGPKSGARGPAWAAALFGGRCIPPPRHSLMPSSRSVASQCPADSRAAAASGQRHVRVTASPARPSFLGPRASPARGRGPARLRAVSGPLSGAARGRARSHHPPRRAA